MSSTAIATLHEKIQNVQRRRKHILLLRQSSFVLAGIVVLFLLLAFLEMSFQFTVSGHSVLLAVFLGGALFLIGAQLRKVLQMSQDQQQFAHYIEEHLPDLEQRLLTAIEFEEQDRHGVSSQLVEHLWEDAQKHVQRQNIQAVTPQQKIWPATSLAAIAVVALLLALGSSVDFSRASRHILWPWGGGAVVPQPVALTVAPGDLRIQRGKNVTVIATVENMTPAQVKLSLQTDHVHWEEFPMAQEGKSTSYAYYLSSIQKDTTYYVDIGEKRSRQYQITVFEMPRIENLVVEYVYPQYTGIAPHREENIGDIVAPEGTDITLSMTSNKPLHKATLTFENGTVLDMAISENLATGSFQVAEDTRYTLQIVDNEQLENENPPEYFVRAVADTPPEVTLVRPGKDRKVTALEEVTIVATAKDDYGLDQFTLHYRLPGKEEQIVPLLAVPKRAQNLTQEGRTLIYLEELQVEPGNFITYYLSAQDNNAIQGASEVFSDIYFLEVISTEEEFLRATTGQQSGGGLGGGRNRQPSALAENQKKIIAATWKLLQQQKTMGSERFAEDVKIIARSQREVLQRAQMSFQRLAERFSFSDETYDKAVNYMKEALEYMAAAAEKLETAALKEALAPEQSALQAILKADALSKQTRIQIARNRGQAGNGDREQREREDLRELFEMEMGRLENRYELPQRPRGGNPQTAAEEDFLTKLRELARRQERINRAQSDLARREKQMSEEAMRRELEQLRREQEELSQQAQELAQQRARLNQQQQGRGRSSNQQRQRQLSQASQQMQEAAQSLSQQNLQNAANQSQQALENLRNQEQALRQNQTNPTANLVDALTQKAFELNEQEKQIQQSLQQIQDQPNAQVAQTKDQHRNLENSEAVQEVLNQKEQLQGNLNETEKVLRAVIARGEQAESQVTIRAMDALRSLQSRQIKERIEETKYLLKEGMVEESREIEKQIAQQIDQFSTRLQNIAGNSAQSRDDQIQQATTNARNLQRALQNLKRQVEALRQQTQQSQQAQQALAQLQRGQQPAQQNNQSGPQGQSGQRGQPNLAQPEQAGGDRFSGYDQGGRIDRMRNDLRRIQRYARGLIAPWSFGERWAVDARSVHRELSQKEVEDFLAQPDLWKRLEQPVQEIQEKLQAQAEINQVKKKLFSARQEDIPETYQTLVEEYYRALSQQNERRVVR